TKQEYKDCLTQLFFSLFSPYIFEQPNGRLLNCNNVNFQIVPLYTSRMQLILSFTHIHSDILIHRLYSC
ncbi:MAG: hypothetical protein M0P61_13030, partial [Ignavibacteriaceae bacterium]|nr:hypothetical protein [Ignavibacteriaceae bacterium]